MRMVDRKEQERLQRQEKQRTNLGAFPKMAKVVDGQYRIKDQPPLIVHDEKGTFIRRSSSS